MSNPKYRFHYRGARAEGKIGRLLRDRVVLHNTFALILSVELSLKKHPSKEPKISIVQVFFLPLKQVHMQATA